MAFPLPGKVTWTKTVNGNQVQMVFKVFDFNNLQHGPNATYNYDVTQIAPQDVFKIAMSFYIEQVNADLSWADVPASGTLNVPIVDYLEQA